MKRFKLIMTLISIVIVMNVIHPVLAAPRLVDVRRLEPVHGNAAAGSTKAATCIACHGAEGSSISPVFPNLAGQTPEYLYLQLKSYREGWRASPVMQPLVASLSDSDLRDLSQHYAGFSRAAKGNDVSADVKEGERLYRDGDAARGLPPCQGCHGEHGTVLAENIRVNRQYRTYPTLAGQQSEYVRAQLVAFRDRSRSTTSNARIMNGVADSLDDHSIEVLAAYLAQL